MVLIRNIDTEQPGLIAIADASGEDVLIIGHFVAVTQPDGECAEKEVLDAEAVGASFCDVIGAAVKGGFEHEAQSQFEGVEGDASGVDARHDEFVVTDEDILRGEGEGEPAGGTDHESDVHGELGEGGIATVFNVGVGAGDADTDDVVGQWDGQCQPHVVEMLGFAFNFGVLVIVTDFGADVRVTFHVEEVCLNAVGICRVIEAVGGFERVHDGGGDGGGVMPDGGGAAGVRDDGIGQPDASGRGEAFARGEVIIGACQGLKRQED